MKIKWFLLLIIFSGSLKATDLAKGRFSLFSYNQHGKVLAMNEIIVDGDKITVDGVKLSPQEVTIKSKFLKTFVKIEKKLNKNQLECDEGKFILKKIIQNRESVESGCLDSGRFIELNQIFTAMKKDIIIK